MSGNERWDDLRRVGERGATGVADGLVEGRDISH